MSEVPSYYSFAEEDSWEEYELETKIGSNTIFSKLF